MLKYGYDKIGCFDDVKCECGWKGKRAELLLYPRYDGYDEDGEAVWIENYYGCPICINEDVS